MNFRAARPADGKVQKNRGHWIRGFKRESKEARNMTWERPSLIEIAMNAEIGGYQSDFGDEVPLGPSGPVLRVESNDTEDHATKVP